MRRGHALIKLILSTSVARLSIQNGFGVLQIVEERLGGHWGKPFSKWEGRRDGVLDLIGKATPRLFQPSLQIDGTGAKLLIEALSGRWSYDTERREKRTVWY